MENKEIIIGVDIGSRKICAIVAELKDGILRIIGTAHEVSKEINSKAIRRGRIYSLAHASNAIKEVITSAKKMAGLNTHESQSDSVLPFEESYNPIKKTKAIVSFSGAYTESIRDIAGVASTRENVVTIDEINRAINNACAKAGLDNDKHILHALPYRFTLDKQEVNDPLGMSGSRLEVFVHIVYTDKNNIENLEKIMIQSGAEIENIVLNSYAASIATLSDDEKGLGAACVDIGGETCNLMIYSGNSMRYSHCFSAGSHHLSTDLSLMLNTPFPYAEEVKIKYGDLSFESEEESQSQNIQIPTTGSDGNENHVVPLSEIQSIMRERALETFEIIHRSIQISGLEKHLGGGVVLTGGMALMKGIKELAKTYFANYYCPVRLATPMEKYNIMGMFEDLKDPRFSVAVGLILYKAGGHTNYERDSKGIIRYHESNDCIRKVHQSNPTSYFTSSHTEMNLTDLKTPNTSFNAPKDDDFLPIKSVEQKGFFKNFLDKISKIF
ncbi:cell division protein FtsA [Helicobacter cetorum]|uniref:Cell division protein FtsA n=1 Tax=Helicobacter cetorum (strain ATCC BAA-540 / CCUG 52418 / MIT 99-5656) TaxID=1163745 RepID=I0ETY2_HELCM|nr:cell division protein FtsA [Helicobacter cetorum]AFI06401.1 cell division protein FtsA [Helicobacter cetorum MIT 99-5656]